MDLGSHYLALNVADIQTSKEFYEKLGFEVHENGGSVKDKWLVMFNGNIKIGLFEDMIPRNTITFNPDNARTVYNSLKKAGIAIELASDNIEEGDGPCHFAVIDPDGNPIFFDQH